MTDILFIDPPINSKIRLGDLSSIGSHHPPLNLCYLSAVTEQNGWKTMILDCETLKLDHESARAEISRINPRFIGITAMTLSIESAAQLAEKIKKMNSSIPVIIGGIHLTALPVKTMRDYPQFDIGVIGEGEATIIELLETLSCKGLLEKIKGIIYRKNGELKITPERPLINDLGKLPFPAFHLIPELGKYYWPSFQKFKRRPSTLLMTSRGCPQQCVFCDSIGFKNIYRDYSVPAVIGQIKKLQNKYGITDINFYDPTFTFSREKTVELCHSLIKGKIDLTWSCQTRVDKVDPELLKLMKNAGCWSVAFGLESGEQKVLDFLKKDITVEKAKRSVNWANKAGLETIGFIIIGSPAETKESMEITIKYLKEINLSYVLPLYFTPFPNTESFCQAEKYGQLLKEWNKWTTFNPVFIPKGLSEKLLRAYQRKIYLSFYFKPKTAFKFIKKIIRGYSWKKLIFEGLTFINISLKNKTEN